MLFKLTINLYNGMSIACPLSNLQQYCLNLYLNKKDENIYSFYKINDLLYNNQFQGQLKAIFWKLIRTRKDSKKN